ncbi:methyltransferase [Nocardioides terrisoli]|uniref:methyltransferase n=1 Tax=Nocardioides terrisoli TaxID=3388267 RepID=UPI00287BA93B|nr:methyltransferase domain-containing protein [Nocardioides marmorisolisilvae]
MVPTEPSADRPIERPLARRSAVRSAVVWEALRSSVALATPGQAVVDLGGGTGGFAVRIAELGHQVTVVDPSPDALAAAARRAEEAGVTDRVVGRQGDVADLAELVGAASADLVLCHGVLGLLDDAAGALSTVASVVRPGGTLSLLVGQRHAAVLARAMAGHFGQARELLAGVDRASGERRFTADECTTLLVDAGFTVDAVHGVRVFADLVPSTLLDLEPGAAEALLDLERDVAERPEFRTLATQLHLLCSKR